MKVDFPAGELARFERNILRRVNEFNKELPKEINQRLANVASRMIDELPPKGGEMEVAANRAKVRAYWNEPISTRIKRFTSGKRKGRFWYAVGKKRELMRVHLIAQAINAKKGRKGLYGNSMKKYAGKMRRRSSFAVGFMKSLMVPVIKALNPHIRFKVPFLKTKYLYRWKSSAGETNIKPATAQLMTGEFTVGASTRKRDAFISQHLNSAATKALQDENMEMEQHMQKRFEELMKGWN